MCAASRHLLRALLESCVEQERSEIVADLEKACLLAAVIVHPGTRVPSK